MDEVRAMNKIEVNVRQNCLVFKLTMFRNQESVICRCFKLGTYTKSNT